LSYDKERVIKPPIDHITSGRLFRPYRAFLFKKMLKVGIILVLIWLGLWLLFIGFTNPVFLEIILALAGPVEILVALGWEMVSLTYSIAAIAFYALGTVYTFIYVNRIEYSVIGWSGDAMPFIYTRKGIINITKKHVPFRTIVNVRTRKGIFDRLFRIGTVLIETAGGSTVVQPTGIMQLIIQRLSTSAEEKIEGITFYEELRDFILREMRSFGTAPHRHIPRRYPKQGKKVLNRATLEAFIEIRDVLRERADRR
jgi:membrane protein YdbS with pleckstrin-like domain